MKKRIFYFDALRALAIICVIMVHVYAVTRMYVINDYGIIPSFRWIFSQIQGNCFRIGVDLFLMLAGALSLGRNWTIRDFLSRRIPRIVSPFLFWGLTTSIIAVLLSYYYNFTFLSSFDVNSILNFIYGAFMSTSPGFTPYWFFWMILGTYFIMPIFNKWLANSSLNEAEYFLIFWLITCLFDGTFGIEFPIKLSYFTSPIGFVVAGYYLRHTERKLLNNIKFDVAVLMISAFSMIVIATYMSTPNEFYNLGRYSLPAAIECMSVFLVFKNSSILKKPNTYFKKLTEMIAKYSYGIYLIQGLFLCIYAKILPYYEFYSHVIIMFILILASSIITMYILDKVPYIRNIIGAK